MDTWINGYDTNGVLVFLVITVLPSVVALRRLYRFPSPAFLAKWFEHHELEQTSETVALAARSLVTTKRIRTAGFILGYSGLQLGWILYTRDAHRSDDLPFVPLLLAAWTVTVVIAALWGTPRSSGAASLSERHVDDYRPAFTPIDRQVLVAAMVALTAASFAFPGEKDGTNIDGSLALERIVPALAVMAVVWLAQRAIVGRRQSLPSLDLERVDDALRAVGVSALTGLGYGIPLMAIGSLFWQLSVAHEPSGVLMLFVILAAGALNMFGLMSILGFGKLSNELVIYRHQLRRAAERETPGSQAEQVPR